MSTATVTRRIKQDSPGEVMPGLNLKQIHSSAAAILPATMFAELAGWDKLNPQEQGIVSAEGTGLAQAMLTHGYSGLAMGKHLAAMQSVLEPHSLFGRFLKPFHFSKTTAYRFIRKYENATKNLAPTIVQAALTRGIDIAGASETEPLGIYTQAAAKLPPPKEPDVVQANTWLDQVVNVRKQERSTSAAAGNATSVGLGVPEDPATALKVCYRFVMVQFNKLPNNLKTRNKWKAQLLGILVSGLGISEEQVTSIPVPADFEAQRGRPRVAPVAAA